MLEFFPLSLENSTSLHLLSASISFPPDEGTIKYVLSIK